MKRRRFLSIAAGVVVAPALPAMAAPGLRHWRGVAMGAGASIIMDHPEADRLIAIARAEIDRLEGIFSLYRTDSALSALNRTGRLDAPPFELLDCLSLCGRVHEASGGMFDPTVQPFWAVYAEAAARGQLPDGEDIDRARALVGWDAVDFDASRIRFARDGMALTLNGVAQGVIADRVAGLLRAEGLRDVLIDTGEIAAVGTPPRSQGWPVTLAGQAGAAERLVLHDRALASSALRGTVFDAGGKLGHILDPGAGARADMADRAVSVSANRAGLADALSTAACLVEPEALSPLIAAFPDARLEAWRQDDRAAEA